MIQHNCPQCGLIELTREQAETYVLRGFNRGFQCFICDAEGTLILNGREVKTRQDLERVDFYLSKL